jgi:hypothetical protein
MQCFVFMQAVYLHVVSSVTWKVIYKLSNRFIVSNEYPTLNITFVILTLNLTVCGFSFGRQFLVNQHMVSNELSASLSYIYCKYNSDIKLQLPQASYTKLRNDSLSK